MAADKLIFPMRFIVALLLLMLLVSLYLMSTATQNTAEISSNYSVLLLINTVAVVLLLVLVGINVYWLIRQVRKRAAGSRLTARMIFVFILLALAPSSLVFYYSINFLHQSIDSWFDVEVDMAMEDALELSRASLDERMRAQLKLTRKMADQLVTVDDSLMTVELENLREWSEATEMMIISDQKMVLAYSNSIPELMFPGLPSDSILSRVSRGEDYVGLDPVLDEGMQVRSVVSVGEDRLRFLQVLYPVPVNLTDLAKGVESAYLHYKKMGFLRKALKRTFSLTLFLILLVSLLAAVWATFLSIRRLVEPLRNLEKGTLAVAAGNYERRLPVTSRDELGLLVQSFNYMTEQVAQARDETEQAHLEAENQRAYLETVLRNLTSGVLSIDDDGRLRTANQAAGTILNIDLKAFIGNPITSLIEANPNLSDLITELKHRMMNSQSRWQEELSYTGSRGQRQLLCRGTSLISPLGSWSGAVMVFDDVTEIIQAQRNEAWGAVAQRMAHEIKNPLTPIQLSTERLRTKIANQLHGEDARILEKSTRTIIRQVETLKEMVDAFSMYARSPGMNLTSISINELIEDVGALYNAQQTVTIQTNLDQRLPTIKIDGGRFSRLLHNLIKNAQEATAGHSNPLIEITTRRVEHAGYQWQELVVRDNGCGFEEHQVETIFDPYVTTKIKGTGLGLAIVKKIVEEHQGTIDVNSQYSIGAEFIIRLPETAHVELPEHQGENVL
ncbi:MAG: HAMP domain-containing protein [Gammaproteobacteria bacterium]|nr:HAMP domain-containing protein [Gammaproteobacteria bacterium]